MQFDKTLLNTNMEKKFYIKELIEKLKIKVNKKDKFTDLYNRNYFFYCLNKKNNGSLIKIKIMGINYINLQYGIKQADEMIK